MVVINRYPIFQKDKDDHKEALKRLFLKALEVEKDVSMRSDKLYFFSYDLTLKTKEGFPVIFNNNGNGLPSSKIEDFLNFSFFTDVLFFEPQKAEKHNQLAQKTASYLASVFLLLLRKNYIKSFEGKRIKKSGRPPTKVLQHFVWRPFSLPGLPETFLDEDLFVKQALTTVSLLGIKNAVLLTHYSSDGDSYNELFFSLFNEKGNLLSIKEKDILDAISFSENIFV